MNAGQVTTWELCDLWALMVGMPERKAVEAFGGKIIKVVPQGLLPVGGKF